MGILWTVIIGFLAGVIAKFIMPGDNEPTGFILTACCDVLRTGAGMVSAWRRCRTDRCRGWRRYHFACLRDGCRASTEHLRQAGVSTRLALSATRLARA